jgi:hypothetical protein
MISQTRTQHDAEDQMGGNATSDPRGPAELQRGTDVA